MLTAYAGVLYADAAEVVMPGVNRGAANGMWRGGVRHKDGYRLILRPEHPNADRMGYVREHVLVMTEKLGRPLAPGETVHHKNEVRDDNREENLELLTRAEHTSLHHKGLLKPNSLKNLRRTTSHDMLMVWATTRAHQKAKLKPCARCGTPFRYSYSPKQKFCGPGCYRATRKGI